MGFGSCKYKFSAERGTCINNDEVEKLFLRQADGV